jgi:hypothetical protein
MNANDTTNSPSWIQRCENLDRRWIFLIVALALIFPLIFGINFGVLESVPVRDFYNEIDKLPAGSKVLISADWDPGSMAELYPATISVLNHCFDKKLKVVMYTLWPTGPGILTRCITETAEARGLVDGEDYVFLGFKEGRQAVMVAIGESLPATFPQDINNRPVGEIPIMQGVENYNSFPIFINVSAGFPGTKEYVQQVQSRFGLNMLSTCAGISAPEYYPYYEAGQLSGLCGGLKATAEYEQMIGHKGKATAAMGAQTFGHYIIVLLILFSNVMYFWSRRKRS